MFARSWRVVAMAAAGGGGAAAAVSSASLWPWQREEEERYTEAKPPIFNNSAREKIEGLRKDRMMAIIDFDRTISSKESVECHHMVGTSHLMPEEFLQKFTILIDNPKITGKAWWELAHGLMIEYGLTKNQLTEIVETERHCVPRPGMKDLLDLLEKEQIPVLVVSAGLQDAIERVFRKWGFRHKNTTVVSNVMIFDDEGKIKDFAEPQITSRNKRLTYERNIHYFDHHIDRNQFVIIGDSPRDADIKADIPIERGSCVTIGFNDGLKSWATDEQYVEKYDVIIRNGDATLIVRSLQEAFLRS